MIRINPDMGYLKVARKQEQRIEQSRKYHLILAQTDRELCALESNCTIYTIANYNRCFLAIMKLREQTRKAIEALEDSAQ